MKFPALSLSGPQQLQKRTQSDSSPKRVPKASQRATTTSQKAEKKPAQTLTKSTADAAIERWFSNEFQQNNPHIIQLVRNWVNSNRKEVYSKIYPILYYGSVDLKLVDEKKPSLIITCDQDFSNGPDAAKEIAKNLTNSEVCILKNLRHMALVEDYKKVFSKIDSFIATLGRH